MELLSLAALVAAASYIGGPILVRFTQRMDAAPNLVALDHIADGAAGPGEEARLDADPAGLPAEVTNYFRQVDEELRALGFEAVAYVSVPGALPNVMPYLALHVHRLSGHKAMVTAIYGEADGKVELGTRYLEFSTRFEDGVCVNTMNTPILSAFVQGPGTTTIQVPSVQEPRRLLDLHRWAVAQAPRAAPVMPAPGEELEYLRRVLVESYEEQAATGRLFLDRAAICYRPTWKGACLMTWAQLWPLSTARRAQMKAREAQVLRLFAASRRVMGL